MNEPKRYKVGKIGTTEMIDCVSYEDYARLKAEVERLTPLLGDIVSFDEYFKLLQQVERLTKAGDEMARVVSSFGFDEAPIAWNRAKEGKPRA